MPIGAAIAGGLASGLAGSLFGGGGTSATTQQVKVPGAEFQPFTYTGASGFGVKGTPEGDYGYGYETTLPSWVTDIGATGGAAADPLLQKYLAKLQDEDAYSAADEFYKRGLAQLQPELERQQAELGGSLFGSGRLGLKLAGQGLGYGAGAGAINPDIAGFGAGTTKALSDLYTTSLTKGAQLRADELSQLQKGYQNMIAAGLTPMEVEEGLMKLAADLEGARASAMKAGVSYQPLGETTQSVLGGLAGQAVGSAVSDFVGGGGLSGLFGGGSSSPSWFSPAVSQPVAPSGGYGFSTGLFTSPSGSFNTMPTTAPSGFTFGGY